MYTNIQNEVNTYMCMCTHRDEVNMSVLTEIDKRS